MMFTLLSMVALSSFQPSEPVQHCGIETRVWCLRAGLNDTKMVASGGMRVWTVSSDEMAEPIIVRESSDCDAVTEMASAKISEKTSSNSGIILSDLSYEIPKYQCRVNITWSSTKEDRASSRRYVASIIWVGVEEKQPLIYQIKDE